MPAISAGIFFIKERRKDMKKIISAIAAFAVVLSSLVVSPFAADEKTVSLRIEGKNETYFYGDVTTNASTVAELMNEVDAANDNLTITNPTGTYITAINGDVAGSVAPKYWDGWNDIINGVAPSVGIGEQQIKDGDVIVFYYADEFGSHGFARPAADLSKLGDREITFTSDAYAEDFSLITVPVEGAKVTWDGKEYVTDADGKIVIDKADFTVGDHSVGISKVAEDGVPLVLRFASDYKITVTADMVKAEAPAVTEPETKPAKPAEDVPSGDTGYVYFAVVAIIAAAGIAAVSKKRAYEK